MKNFLSKVGEAINAVATDPFDAGMKAGIYIIGFSAGLYAILVSLAISYSFLHPVITAFIE